MMATTELSTETDASSSRLGIYLAFLQLVFTLLWTTYVIYLAKLAGQVGIAPASVILLLMIDQAIFTITDTGMGIVADRMAPVVGRLSLVVAVLTAVSCLAFVALPYIAANGAGGKLWFIGTIAIWAVTSSALRAPPLVLLGKYRARPRIPFLAALAMLGYGVAGALAPYLGVVLRDQDPRLPFIISSAVLLLTALGLSKIEHEVADPVVRRPAEAPKPLGNLPIVFTVAMVLLSLGYQLHFSINSTPFFLRFAKPDDLQWLLPVFWIGFNIAMFPVGLIVKHRGGLIVMGGAGLLGAAAIYMAETAGALNTLIAAQFVAGAAWGCMLMSAVSAAIAIGDDGAEGKLSGLVFSALALATFARMSAVAGGLQKLPDYAPLLHWAPVACWSVAGAGLLAVVAARVQGARRV
jgi:Major Facilitator Superfamily